MTGDMAVYQPLSHLDHLPGFDSEKAAEVAWRAHPLVARTTFETMDLYSCRRPLGRTPRRRARRQRGPIDRDHRHATGGGDVHRPAVAAYIKGSPLHEG